MNIWIIFGLIVFALALSALQTWFLNRQYHFVCPACGLPFKPGIRKLIVKVRIMFAFILRCPYCGKIARMPPVRD